MSEADGRPLADRTREVLADFAREDKGYAFNDGGDGTAYAWQMAELLEEWLRQPVSGSSSHTSPR